MQPNKKLALSGIIISVLLFYAVTMGLFGLNKITGNTITWQLWLSRIEFWIILLIVYLYAKKVEKNNFLLWKERKGKILFYIASIFIILVIITVLLSTISLIMQKSGYVASNKVLDKVTGVLCNNFLLLIFTCLTAAFTEESIFRGYLLPRFFLLTKNKWLAIVLSSLLFGLAHINFGDFERMLFPFIVGIIFSIYYFKYRSLTVLIICHFLMDFYSLYGACK